MYWLFILCGRGGVVVSALDLSSGASCIKRNVRRNFQRQTFTPVKVAILTSDVSSYAQDKVSCNSPQKIVGSTPSPRHRVVFLDKKLYPTLSLSPPRCIKWVPGTYCC